MTTLRAALLFAAIHLVSRFVDQALAARSAAYGRWSAGRRSRRRRRRQRPVYAGVLSKAALSFAVKILLDASRGVALELERRGSRSAASPGSART